MSQIFNSGPLDTGNGYEQTHIVMCTVNGPRRSVRRFKLHTHIDQTYKWQSHAKVQVWMDEHGWTTVHNLIGGDPRLELPRLFPPQSPQYQQQLVSVKDALDELERDMLGVAVNVVG
jgi:hypothetical protein